VDDGVRGGRLFLILSVALGACGPREPAPLVGTSLAHDTAHASTPDAGAPASVAVLRRDFRTTFTKASRTRFVSKGHLDDRFTADVYVNAQASGGYASEIAAFSPGAMLVKEQFDRTSGQPAGILAMEKREAGFDPENGDWRWIVIDAKGALVGEGKLERCAACHRESKHDFVFRVVE
jgi:hypothetical protein